jgi:hypothetical protein
MTGFNPTFDALQDSLPRQPLSLSKAIAPFIPEKIFGGKSALYATIVGLILLHSVSSVNNQPAIVNQGVDDDKSTEINPESPEDMVSMIVDQYAPVEVDRASLQNQITVLETSIQNAINSFDYKVASERQIELARLYMNNQMFSQAYGKLQQAINSYAPFDLSAHYLLVEAAKAGVNLEEHQLPQAALERANERFSMLATTLGYDTVDAARTQAETRLGITS